MTGTTEVRTDELVISAWSAVSPFGVGSAAFSEGIRSGQSAVDTIDLEVHPGPFTTGGIVPGFSAAEHVGRKGTRTMDRVTALAVTAVGRLLEACGPGLTAAPEEVGLVLGTGSGSVQSIMDFTRDSLVGERPYHVDPARFPNTVMNRAAGQSAIWYGIKGPNTTIAGGWLTGLLALSYAVRLHRGGHCRQVLCGAAEEYSVQRAWLEWHGRRGDGPVAPLGEGAAVFLLESAEEAANAGRTALARVLTTRFRAFGEQAEARAALARCVTDALAKVGAAPADVRLVVPLGPDGELGELEQAGITDALGAAEPEWVRCRALLGDTSAAAAGLQLAAAISVAGDRSLWPGELTLVTGIDRDGNVGCVLLGGCEPAP